MLVANLRPATWSPEDAGDLRTHFDSALGRRFLERLVALAPSASEISHSGKGSAEFKLGYLDGWEQAITTIKHLSMVESADTPQETLTTKESEEYPPLDDDSAWPADLNKPL